MPGQQYDIAFIGYGKMAQAISTGLDHSGRIPYARQAASARHFGKLDSLAKSFGFTAVKSNEELLEKSRRILVAVEPAEAVPVLQSLRSRFSGQLVVSIAAGLTLAVLTEAAGPGARLARAMPNTPVLVGSGVTAVCLAPGLEPTAINEAREIFEAVGFCFELEEEKFPALSSLSGCGPAYFFTFMEALTDGGVLLGLKRELAQTLAARTALGAAELALSANAPFSELRALTSSPGGMTVEATYALERGGLRGLVMEAMRAAFDKDAKLREPRPQTTSLFSKEKH